MHSSSHDAKFGADADSGLPAHVVDIVVLTTDGGLLATLREVCGPQHAIWHAQSADACVDLLVGGRCGILIADLGTLRGDVPALLDRLHSQFPELVLIASGRREDEYSVASLMSDGRIYRFLHKPLSPARANQFVSAATRRYAELRHVEPLMVTTVKAFASRRNWGVIVASVVACLGAIFLLVMWLSSQGPPEPRFTSGSYATTSSQQIADALGRAQIAYLSGRLADPKGDNALEYFQTVLVLQPDHPEALAGIERVIEALESRVRKALEARDAAKGVIALTRLQRARPDHPRIDALRADLIALARGIGSSSAASHTQTERRATATPTIDTAGSNNARDSSNEPSAGIAAAIALRQRGQLIEPPQANAYERLMAVGAVAPDSPDFLAEQQRLVFALLESARTALAAGDLDRAEAFTSRADTLLPGMTTTRTLSQQIAAARAQREAAP